MLNEVYLYSNNIISEMESTINQFIQGLHQVDVLSMVGT